MQLKWVNPWRFLAFRLFSWFWLVLLLTMAGAWLLAKGLNDNTEIRRLPHDISHQLQPLPWINSSWEREEPACELTRTGSSL